MSDAAQKTSANASVPIDFLHQVEDKFVAVAKEVGHDLLLVGEEVINEGEKLLQQLVDLGAPIAMQAVISRIPMVASGREKFGQAVAETISELEIKTVPVVLQDAQMLVQAAFRKAQQLFGTAAVAKNTTPSA